MTYGRGHVITVKTAILDRFSKHFESVQSDSAQDFQSASLLCAWGAPGFFSFMSFSVSEVWRALKNVDTSKSAGPDKLDPFFLKVGLLISSLNL